MKPLPNWGTQLQLPPPLEPHRARIEKVLPPVELPQTEIMSTQDLGFVHRFVPAQNDDRRTLLLLHGTGGTEDDLLDIGRALLPTAALLSPRGKVLENGMPRFFSAFGGRRVRHRRLENAHARTGRFCVRRVQGLRP
jgi:hypothetical protein